MKKFILGLIVCATLLVALPTKAEAGFFFNRNRNVVFVNRGVTVVNVSPFTTVAFNNGFSTFFTPTNSVFVNPFFVRSNRVVFVDPFGVNVVRVRGSNVFFVR